MRGVPPRTRRRLSSVLLCVVSITSAARSLAQDPELDGPALTEAQGEEIIVDPELDGATAPAPQGEVIVDPELAGATPTPSGAAGSESIVDPELTAPASSAASGFGSMPQTGGTVRVVLHSRTGLDLSFDDPREDIVESTQLALFEATVRRSERLRFVVGLRARYLFAAREHDTPEAEADRYELDVTPTAGYADWTVDDGAHLRLGYQTTQLGRFDVFGAGDVLSSYDLRSGPATLPEASAVAQPALRLDWDIDASIALRLVYLPFFVPHLAHAVEGDYALAPSSQSDVDDAIDEITDPSGPITRRYLTRLLHDSLSRTAQGELAESGFDALAPEPGLDKPQAALRLDMRGADGELGLTLALARERLPAFAPSASVLGLLAADPDDVDAVSEARAAFFADSRPFALRYDPFAAAVVDGALPIGPIQLGLELAYQRGRTLFAARAGELALPEQADLAQIGLRAEWLHGSDLFVLLEGFGAYAIQQPDDPAREWMFLSEGRLLYGAVAFAAFAPGAGPVTLELGAGFYNGPSYLVAPRAELRVADGLYVELGALVVGGEAVPAAPGAPNVALGGIYDDADQIFVGLRYLP